MGNQERGAAAEAYAARVLADAGYRVVETNYRSRGGEIDIIAVCEHLIVFVEVKQRTGNRYGSAIEAVDPQKVSRMLETADVFILNHPQYADFIWRLDAIAITLNRDGSIQQVDHIENLIVD